MTFFGHGNIFNAFIRIPRMLLILFDLLPLECAQDAGSCWKKNTSYVDFKPKITSVKNAARAIRIHKLLKNHWICAKTHSLADIRLAQCSRVNKLRCFNFRLVKRRSLPSHSRTIPRALYASVKLRKTSNMWPMQAHSFTRILKYGLDLSRKACFPIRAITGHLR